MNWEEFWKIIVDFFTANVWNIVTFALVLVFGLVLIKVILMILKRILRARKVDEMAIRFVSAILRFVLLLLWALILLSILGVPVSGVTTAFSAAVLAVGMALKDFLSNVASGIILVGSGKYKTGDYVTVGSVEGSVVDINFLFTTLKTPNSTQVTLPNSTMVNSPVSNLSAYPMRRVAITFPVAYESDTKLVKKVLIDVMNSCPTVLADPAPECNLKDLSDSSIDFFATCFCPKGEYWNTYFYVMDHAFDELKRNDIEIPYQQVVVDQKKERPAPIAYPEGLVMGEKVTLAKDPTKVTMDDFEDLTFKEYSEKLAQQRREEKEEREKAKAAKAKKKPAPEKPNPKADEKKKPAAKPNETKKK